MNKKVASKFDKWRKDWCLFAREMLRVNLDPEQEAILRSVQNNKMTSVASGTARGKDFVAAVASVCFMYLTPRWNIQGELIENTKVAMTAPTDRQVGNIMFPEVSRIWHQAKHLPGRLTGYDIRTENKEWFLTGFKADEYNHEAWSGFHAANTMFVITEASGIPELVFSAIEGNLQGNSRILIVFNPNTPTGYAASSQKNGRWQRFRLDSLSAPNVKLKKQVIPGQVDYEWIKDKVENWCEPIAKSDFKDEEGDFEFDGRFYRPNDLFRVKVRGMFPKVSSDILVPPIWIELANKRWQEKRGTEQLKEHIRTTPLRLGADVAGMGRDSSCFCNRYGDYIESFDLIQSGGVANHMEIVGVILNKMKASNDLFNGTKPQAFIDTIGEGAGVYSRLIELAEHDPRKIKSRQLTDILKGRVHSVKFSNSATNGGGYPLKDETNVYEFQNMRAYLYWAVRDWLNPRNRHEAALPVNEKLALALSETKWEFMSNGKIKMESKDDLKSRLKFSPDEGDALANTFYPVADLPRSPQKAKNLSEYFF